MNYPGYQGVELSPFAEILKVLIPLTYIAIRLWIIRLPEKCLGRSTTPFQLHSRRRMESTIQYQNVLEAGNSRNMSVNGTLS